MESLSFSYGKPVDGQTPIVLEGKHNVQDRRANKHPYNEKDVFFGTRCNHIKWVGIIATYPITSIWKPYLFLLSVKVTKGSL